MITFSKFKPLLIASMLLAGAVVRSCNSSKNVLYMQNSRYNHEEAIVNLNKIKVQPQDQISIVVSCKEPEVAALFNLLVANNRLGTGSSGSNNSGQIACCRSYPSGNR